MNEDKIIQKLDQISDNQKRHDEKFEKIDEKFEKIDERFDRQDEKFEKIDEKFEKIDERFDRQDEKFDLFAAKMLEHDEKMDQFVTKDEFYNSMSDIKDVLDGHTVILKRLDQERIFTLERIKRIEEEIAQMKVTLNI